MLATESPANVAGTETSEPTPMTKASDVLNNSAPAATAESHGWHVDQTIQLRRSSTRSSCTSWPGCELGYPRPRVRDFCLVDGNMYGDIRIRYNLYGDEDAPKKILLVMGLSMRLEAWANLINLLLENNDCEICAYDNRGCGESSMPNLASSTSIMARDASYLISHLGWDTAHFVGISLGGMIGQEFMSRHTVQLKSCTLINTGPGLYNTTLLPSLETMLRYCYLEVQNDNDKAMRNISSFLYSDKTCRDEKRVEQLLVGLKDILQLGHAPFAGLTHLAAGLGHCMREDRMHQIRDSGVPVQLICGDSDVLVPPTNSYHMRKHLNAKLFTVENAGHDVVNEHPEVVSERICDFIDKAEEKWSTRNGLHYPIAFGLPKRP
eukprot:Clim_evm8s85 gene=Clim_evmTU8s85